MKKRDWPEEMDWIRKQDQKMYQLINILSVVAMLLLVCVVAHRATASGAESAMSAGMAWVSEDAVPVEMIRLAVSDHQMAGAIVSVQDALLQASLESDAAVLELSVQNEQQIEMEESAYADLVIAQIGNDEYINEEANRENGIVGEIYDGTAAETGDVVGTAEDSVAQYAVLKDDGQNVRGQPDSLAGHICYSDTGEQMLLEAQSTLLERGGPPQEDRTEILIDLAPPDIAYTSNEEFGRSMANYAMRPNCVRALS